MILQWNSPTDHIRLVSPMLYRAFLHCGIWYQGKLISWHMFDYSMKLSSQGVPKQKPHCEAVTPSAWWILLQLIICVISHRFVGRYISFFLLIFNKSNCNCLWYLTEVALLTLFYLHPHFIIWLHIV